MGALRRYARAYKKLNPLKSDTIGSPELFLQCFTFVSHLTHVELRTKRDTMGTNPPVRHTYGPDQVLHLEPHRAGDSREATYYRCFSWLLKHYVISRHQRGQWTVEPLHEDRDLADTEMQAQLLNLRGANILPIQIRPTFKWVPSFNLTVPACSPIKLCAHLAMLEDVGYSWAFSGRMSYYGQKAAAALAWGDVSCVWYDPRKDGVVPSLQWLALKSYYTVKAPDRDPFFISKNSFVSGGSSQGMVEAVTKMCRDKVHTREDPRVVFAAVLRLLRKNKLPQNRIQPLPPTRENIAHVKLESPMSAGISVYSERSRDQLEDLIVEYVHSADKASAAASVRINVLQLVEKIADAIRKTPNLHYDPRLFDPVRVVHKMSLKPESRPPGSDPTKTRIIFVVSAIKTFLDRIIYMPAMERSYNIGANGIGTKWLYGGASRFAKTLGVHKPGEKFWVSLDISKFDQSVLAGLLMVVLFIPWFHYTMDTDHDKIIEKIIIWSLSNSVTKIVKWFGTEWRALFGLMFSGELMTSLGDSWYLEIVFECFDQHIYSLLQGPDKEKFRSAYRRFKDYGDDGLMGYGLWLQSVICTPAGQGGPDLLRDYLREMWHMDLKMEETYVSSDGDPRPDKGLPSFYTQLRPCLSPGPEILYRGPKFLKRYIVKFQFPDHEEDAPWRPTEDYFSKATCIAGNNFSIPIHIMRLRALAMDTFGTNRRAYDFLKRAHDHLLLSPPGMAALPLVADIVSACIRNRDEVKLSVEDVNLLDRVGNPQDLTAIMTDFPSIRFLQSRLVSNPVYTSMHNFKNDQRQSLSAEQLVFSSWANV